MDPFEIPEDVTTIEDLVAAEAAALEAAEQITALEDPTDEQLDQLEAIAAHVEAIRAEGERRAEVAEQRRARADAARARLAPVDDDADDGGPEGDEPDNADEDPADAGEGGVEGPDDAEQGDQGEEPQAQAAAARRRRAPSLIRRTRQVPNPMPARSGDQVVITAAAGIPQVEAGARMEGMDAVTAAFQARSRSHPQGRVPDTYIRHTVATFSRGDMGGLRTDNPEYRDDHQALLDEAARETRLQGGSLVAAGGWCAPSQTLYDLVEMETNDGLFDLPEIGVTRGGIRNTIGPDFSDIYAGVGFSQTETEAIAGTTKDCYEVECPDFTETRLDAVGICVKAPLLTNAAYPELVRRVLNGSMIAHQHKVSVKILTAVQTALGSAVTVPSVGSVARATLTGLELAAEGQRNKFRLGQGTTLEVVVPNWIKVALRDDLQNRTGQENPVTDAQLMAHFAARNLRVQFVYGYGDARIVAVPGGGTCLVDFPDTFPAMIYPAGTFVKGTQDVISLDTVYDTTDLQTNVYTAAFVEEGILVARRAPGGCRLTVPVQATGRTGAHDVTASYGVTDA